MYETVVIIVRVITMMIILLCNVIATMYRKETNQNSKSPNTL